MKLALLVLDMQEGYYDEFSKKSMDKACEYINQAIDIFRKNSLPIIWIQDADKGGIVRGTAEFDIVDSLKPHEKDKRVCKRYRNSFNKTDLLSYIREKSVDTLIITGFSAAYCVLSTYRAPEDYDLRPILLQNAVAGDTNENVKFVESISETTTMEVSGKIAVE